MVERLEKARRLADDLVARETPPETAVEGRPRHRVLAMGDPQASFAWVTRVLERHGALGADGKLAPDVLLVSIGDHFDYGELREDDARGPIGHEALRVLRWLTSHPCDQVRLVAGNHDLCRVMELAFETDASFLEARALARRIKALEETDRETSQRLEREFVACFPRIPTPAIAIRDWGTFTVAQRRAVQEILLAGRFELAVPGRLASGIPALIAHAGVTARELGLLGMPGECDPGTIAAKLGATLAAGLERVRGDWSSGRNAALDLGPIQVPGREGEEGGGFLYHRPANPDRPGAPSWDREGAAPRRFHPRVLPRGLVQVWGHTGHAKCLKELAGWTDETARAVEKGGLRTLVVSDAGIVYSMGIRPVLPDAAVVYFIDGELWKVGPESYGLLELGAVEA